MGNHGKNGRDPLSGVTAGLLILFMIACGLGLLAWIAANGVMQYG